MNHKENIGFTPYFKLSTISIFCLILLVIFIGLLGASLPGVIRVVLFLTVVVIITLSKPLFGIALNLNGIFLFTYFFDLAGIEGGKLFGLRLILFVSLLQIWRQDGLQWTMLKRPVFWIALSIGVVMLTGVMYSSAKDYGTMKTVRYFLFNVAVFSSVMLIPWNKEKLISFSRLVGILGAMLGWASLVFIFYQGLDLTVRISLVENINVIWFSRTLAVSLIAILGVLYIEKHHDILSLFLFYSIPGIVLGMLLSGSRGPLLGALLALVVIILMKKPRSKLGLGLGIIGGIIAIIGSVGYLVVRYSSVRLLVDPTNLTKDISTLHRVMAWIKSMEIIKSNWLIGIGTGGFKPLGIELFPWLSDPFIYPHNLFLEIFLENGLGGLTLLFLFFGLIFKHNQKLNISLYPVRSIFLGFFIFAFFNAQVSGDISMNEGLWLVSGLVLSIGVLGKNE